MWDGGSKQICFTKKALFFGIFGDWGGKIPKKIKISIF